MLPADTALAIGVWFGFRWADSNSNLKTQNLVKNISLSLLHSYASFWKMGISPVLPIINIGTHEKMQNRSSLKYFVDKQQISGLGCIIIFCLCYFYELIKLITSHCFCFWLFQQYYQDSGGHFKHLYLCSFPSTPQTTSSANTFALIPSSVH